MQFRKNSAVYTADGKQVGVIDRVVIDPGTQEVSHVIVRHGWLFTEDKVVPMAWVAEATADDVRLRHDITNLDALPRFEETHYAAYDADEAAATPDSTPTTDATTTTNTTTNTTTEYVQPYYAYPPIGVAWPGFYGDPLGAYALGAYPAQGYKVEVERNIPEGSIALREGAAVVDNRGEQIGTVARILIDDKSQQATHLLITEGWIFREQRLIPLNWVKEVTDEEVQLQVSADFLKRLPERRLQPAEGV